MGDGPVEAMDRERGRPRAPFVPGEALLCAPVLVAMVLTAVNDHWLKALAPGWLTGKLSDLAGLYFFPFLALALIELVVELVVKLVGRAGRGAAAELRRRTSARGFAALLVAEAAAFAVIKLSPACAEWMGEAWGATFGLRARFTPDPTDLCALAVLPLAWRTARARGLLREAQASSGAGEREPSRRRLADLVLLPLGLFLGGCTSFHVPGYRGRAVEYVAVPAAREGGACEPGHGAPRLVRAEGVLLVFHPFRIAWLPRVDWLTPGQHLRALEGWVWIENVSAAPLRVVPPVLRSPEAPLESRVAVARGEAQDWPGMGPSVHGTPLGEHALAPGRGVWVATTIPFEEGFAERFELELAWEEGGRAHAFPVEYARLEP